MMKHPFSAALMAGLFAVTIVWTPLARAEPRDREHDRDRDHGARAEAERKLREYYGNDAEIHIRNETEIEGTRVFLAVIHTPAGEAEASITASGHYIATGRPIQFAELTPTAQATVDLFKAGAVTITREDTHGWWIGVESPEHRHFSVQIDAAGRIRAIRTPVELREAEAREPLASAEHERHVADMVSRRFANAHVISVKLAPHDPGYYSVDFDDGHGHGWVLINGVDDVADFRVSTDRSALPAPVQRTIDRDLRGDRVVSVHVGSDRVYRAVERVAGEEVVLQIRTDGTVEYISTGQLHRN